MMKLFNIFNRSNNKDSSKENREIEVQAGYSITKLTNDVVAFGTISHIRKMKVDKIHLSEGDYFLEGQTIIQLKDELLKKSWGKKIQLKFSGHVGKFLVETGDMISPGDNLLTTKRIEDREFLHANVFRQNKSTLEDTEISLEIDEFTNDKTIKVTKIAGKEAEYFKLFNSDSISMTSSWYDYLGLSLTNHNGYTYISFNISYSEISLAKGDSVILLFEDKSTLPITFNSPGTGKKGYRTNHSEVGFEELEMLLTKRLNKIKVTSQRKRLYAIYHMDILNSPQYATELEGQYLLKFITAKFIEANQEHKL